ncbi:MAG: tRNA (adenosine(37)-N6)-threonylcarbamoyltransferase complex ATPase subunit type 1 TsaE [bacterium]|nr:tRNA (adenosine(37)-N6)-threonylcarbamoyltransferase complex ATPase subunit type 1 TsaE [bacterium]
MVQASRAADRMTGTYICETPSDTFALGERLGAQLTPGDVLLLKGGLGAGKTLLTKGILNALDFDIDEVTSPSFTLVNLYHAPTLDVYHIDLWRLDENSNTASAVGLEEILADENNVTIIEWSEKLRSFSHSGRILEISILGDGDDARTIGIKSVPSA